MMLKMKETVVNYVKILNRRKIEIPMLRSLAFRGIPNEIPGLRPIVWKVLLGYLPRETSKWMEVIGEQKKVYDSLKSELIIIPDMEEEHPLYENDHPLSVNRKSVWN